MSAFKRMHPVIWFSGVIAGIVVFAFTTFATVKYVDEKSAAEDAKNAATAADIAGVKEDIRDTKNMVIDLYRDEIGREPKVRH